jgi:hypothetical protein
VSDSVAGAPATTVTLNDSTLFGKSGGARRRRGWCATATLIVNRSLLAFELCNSPRRRGLRPGHLDDREARNRHAQRQPVAGQRRRDRQFGSVTMFHVTIAETSHSATRRAGTTGGTVAMVTRSSPKTTPASHGNEGGGPSASSRTTQPDQDRVARPRADACTTCRAGTASSVPLFEHGVVTATHPLLDGQARPSTRSRQRSAATRSCGADDRSAQCPAPRGCQTATSVRSKAPCRVALRPQPDPQRLTPSSGGGSRTGADVPLPYWTRVLGEPTAIRYGVNGGYPADGVDAVPATMASTSSRR